MVEIKIPQFKQAVFQWLPPLIFFNTTEETAKFARDVSWALESAIKAVRKRPKDQSGRGAP